MDLKTIRDQSDGRKMEVNYTVEMLEDLNKLYGIDMSSVLLEELLRKEKLKERRNKIEKITRNINEW